MNGRQMVETADREAPRFDLNRIATAAELSLFLRRLAMFEYSARMHLDWVFEFSERQGRLM